MVKIYYSVSGKAGFGVYTDYSLVKRALPFLPAGNCKKFYTFWEAKEHAFNRCNMFMAECNVSLGSADDFFLRANWTYYVDKMPVVFEMEGK